MKTVKVLIQALLILCLSFIFVQTASARDLIASLARMPTLAEEGEDGKLEGLSINLVKAMDEVYKEGSIKIELYPPRRAMDNVIKGKGDFYFPILQNPRVPDEKLTYGFTSATLFEVEFYLYRHKDNKEISVDKIKSSNGDGFKLETDRSHMDCFAVKIQPSDDMGASLRKVVMGRIDGFIFSPMADDIVERLKIQNLEKDSYGTFNSKLVISKGDRGKEIDRIISPLIEKLKETGAMDELFGGGEEETEEEPDA